MKMSVPRTIRIRALALTAVCAVSLGIAACGDDDETTTTPAADTTTAESGEAVSGDIREQFDEVVRQSLESAAAAGAPIDVDCAVERLQEVLSDEDVQALIDASQAGQAPPSDIQEELASAGAECVSTGG
jgi:hypothetical protein